VQAPPALNLLENSFFLCIDGHTVRRRPSQPSASRPSAAAVPVIFEGLTRALPARKPMRCVPESEWQPER
jgi:hypothetical protein